MSKEITVSLTGGGVRTIPAGTPARELLSGKLAKLAIGVLIDGHPRDLSAVLSDDCWIAPILPDSEEGLDLIRHSSAHLLAHAVKRLFPEAQVTIGPVIADGFFYDFKFDRGFAPEDLERIEAEMAKIVSENIPVTREEMPRDEATAFFRSMGEEFKAEIIAGLTDSNVGLYRQGDFIDLCRGPHVPETGRLGAFKLLSVAGAYWRGDEKNPMLQRIYGTAWADRKALEQHLARLEEAKRRDHRKLGKQLGLFSFHKEAPGSPFFHPDGALVYNLLVEYIRGLYRQYDYSEVITPQVLDVDLWHRSGHYENYRENMYFTSVEEREFAVKPMNCPTHCLMYGEDLHSYRELPIRFADFGRLHRFERSGVVHGLTRVRTFCQDDAHIFCAPEQIQAEIRSVIEMIRHMNSTFGFSETRVYLSTRPEKSIGSDEMWKLAEDSLREVLASESVEYKLNAGDGAFYGPKIDFCVLDAVGREWQLSTVQLDFSLPERFELSYIDTDGKAKRPVMIHRAVLGSLERFLGILIEHTAGALPLWLAPCQVLLVTVTDRQNEFAAEVTATLKRAGIRARSDLRNEKLGFKIREAQAARIPVVAVVGDKEVAGGTVAPRLRGGEQVDPMTVEEFTGWLRERSRSGVGGVP
ncbi:MAG TPA: threonine--tRNA ligase [Candidatus Limnocylindrales bacterium]|nr:threonine--tRNA ligase [Candidatus Limnocylindrales bacterium]